MLYAHRDDSLAASVLEAGVYGYLLFQGARLLSSGSERLLEILNPGIIGGAPPLSTLAIPATRKRDSHYEPAASLVLLRLSNLLARTTSTPATQVQQPNWKYNGCVNCNGHRP